MNSNVGNGEHMSVGNVWAELPIPLSDIFQQEVAPYLKVVDFVHLSAVSRRYQILFGATGSQGSTKPLADLLRREADHHPPGGGSLYYTNQLPTIGKLTVEESLQEDPLLVAQLRKGAMRRRKLILLHYPSQRNHDDSDDDSDDDEHQHGLDEGSQLQLRTVIRSFLPKNYVELNRIRAEFYQRVGSSEAPCGSTSFVAVNLSGVDIYCHWIDFDGEVTVRDGDRIPPGPNGNEQQPSFVVNHNSNQHSNPRHVFEHGSYVTHAFALCFQSGGPPFAIYQPRTW
ncbi:expressed unknown protein [Seminavis robusta]|uniref:Uncharacterized protein n=1 Tax=Seminavis robusta TaxID=568900 RepID=A0A9N8EP57_9STRA|nr:expressed unknown protein [Seminavis robusta]|eukprot:Sro1514_g278840.1 n/a (284) ;mRNA; f:456-1307